MLRKKSCEKKVEKVAEKKHKVAKVAKNMFFLAIFFSPKKMTTFVRLQWNTSQIEFFFYISFAGCVFF